MVDFYDVVNFIVNSRPNFGRMCNLYDGDIVILHEWGSRWGKKKQQQLIYKWSLWTWCYHSIKEDGIYIDTHSFVLSYLQWFIIIISCYLFIVMSKNEVAIYWLTSLPYM